MNTILRDSESLLDQAKKREEELQNKYCFDIQKAVWLNKQLNNIISKKNKLLADIKIKQNKKEVETNHEKMKLCKENAELYNEYNKILEMKEYEKFSIEEEKNKLLDDLDRLEMEKLKSEYKSNLLEEENKLIFNKMIDNIKNNK